MFDIEFNPMAFVDNLEYMLIGMVGIFAVIGVIMAVTIILNKSSKGDE